jgi:antitoxin ParD1/3/4
MTLTLPADLRDFIADKVQTGAFSSEEEVIRAAVTLMKENDGAYERQLAWLRGAIEEGWQSARAGDLTSAEDFEAEFEEYKRQLPDSNAAQRRREGIRFPLPRRRT